MKLHFLWQREGNKMGKKIGILALQGAFIEHEKMLNSLGAECIELRQEKDLEKEYEGIIFPGGESTVQTKLLFDLSMYQPLKEQIQSGMPVLGTCAGMILLVNTFRTFPGKVKRNAYGRQLGSFEARENVGIIESFPMTFIRAPYMTELGEQAEELSVVDGKIVAAKYKNQLALAFHPELTDDTRIHRYFLDLI